MASDKVRLLSRFHFLSPCGFCKECMFIHLWLGISFSQGILNNSSWCQQEQRDGCPGRFTFLIIAKMDAVTYAERITNHKKQKQECLVLERICVANLHCEPKQLIRFPTMSAKEESDCAKLSFPKVPWNYLQNGLLS